MSISASYPTLRPTLLLDFANSGRLDPRVTFTRASTATYFDETGVLQSAAINTPRFDYDPDTLAARGFLIEEARTNLALRSEDFANATWTKDRSSITSNVIVAPDGTTTGDKLVEDTTASNTHICSQAFSFTSGTTYSGSFYAKAAERTFLLVALNGGFSAAQAGGVNLTTGAVIAGIGTPTITTVNAGNGWWRVQITATADLTASGSLLIYTSQDGVWANRSYTGDGTSGIYIWGAQLEIASTTINNGTASGTTTAVVLSAGSATDGIYVGNVLFVNGEYRVITAYVGSTKTATVAALTATPSGAYVVTGGSAAFATSYIPTTSTALTRSADVASVNTLSPWFNATEGTLFTESLLTRQNATADNQTATIRNAANTGQIKLLYRGSGATGQLVIDTSVTQADLTATGVISANATVKMALAYAANDFAASGNGGAVVTDPSGTVPSGLDRMKLGALGLNGYLRRVTYYPRKLSSAELQSITA